MLIQNFPNLLINGLKFTNFNKIIKLKPELFGKAKNGPHGSLFLIFLTKD